jgi:cytochrome c oxidase subunit 2
VESPTPSAPDRRANRSGRARSRRWAVAGGIVAALVLSGCQLPTFGLHRGVTTQAQDTFKLWQGFMIAGLIVGGFVGLLILWAVFRYRGKPDEGIPRQTQYHTAIEIVYTIVPIVIVLVLFYFTVITENEVTDRPASPVSVKVVAFQWGWDFRYKQYGIQNIGRSTPGPNGISAPPPEMVLPEGENVAVTLHSNDVIHGFFVPQFNYSEYAMPGYDNHFVIYPIKAGEFRGQCTQLCGLYHSLMLFNVIVLPKAQFATWVSDSQEAIRHPNRTAPVFTASIGGHPQVIPLGIFLNIPKGTNI